MEWTITSFLLGGAVCYSLVNTWLFVKECSNSKTSPPFFNPVAGLPKPTIVINVIHAIFWTFMSLFWLWDPVDNTHTGMFWN